MITISIHPGKLAGEDTMARFKHIDIQLQCIAGDQGQLLPGITRVPHVFI